MRKVYVISEVYDGYKSIDCVCSSKRDAINHMRITMDLVNDSRYFMGDKPNTYKKTHAVIDEDDLLPSNVIMRFWIGVDGSDNQYKYSYQLEEFNLNDGLRK